MRDGPARGCLIAGFVVIAWVANAQSNPPSPSNVDRVQPPYAQSSHGDKTPAIDWRDAQESPVIVKVLTSEEEKQNAAADVEHDKQRRGHHRHLAAFTERLFWAIVALSVIVLFQFFAFAWQGVQLRRAVKAANDEFVSTHRPKLIVREAYCPLPPPDGACVSIFVTIANIGETDATIVESAVGFDLVTEKRYVCAPRCDKERNDLDVAGPIRPGEAHKFTVTSATRMWDAQAKSTYADPALGFFLVGSVAYKDMIGIRRQVAFWRKYDPASRRFVRDHRNENDYEYCD
jgi:hypothetical protein